MSRFPRGSGHVLGVGVARFSPHFVRRNDKLLRASVFALHVVAIESLPLYLDTVISLCLDPVISIPHPVISIPTLSF